MKLRSRIIAAGAAVLATGAILAAPASSAWAQNCDNPQTSFCLPVNGTVPTTVSLTLTSPSTLNITLVPGGNTQVNGAVAYTSSTNDPSGLHIDATQMSQFGPGGNTITITSQQTKNGTNYGSPITYVPVNTVTVGQTSSATTDQWSENWTLSTPSSLGPGTYSTSFDYVAAGL